jgi:uncharacterized protein (DUF4415 family)
MFHFWHVEVWKNGKKWQTKINAMAYLILADLVKNRDDIY